MTKCNKHLRMLLALLVLPVFLFTGCLKEGDDTIVLPVPYGKIPYDVIPERIQDSLMLHGFVINEGVYPPSIEGKYVASPMDVQYASDNYFNESFRYLYMAFSGQHLRGKLDYRQVQRDTIFLNEQQFIDASGEAPGQVIGKDSNFTMYCIQTTYVDEIRWSKTASVVSGTWTKAGIKNCQYAECIIETHDDPSQPRLSEVGTYRIWNDGDKLAIPSFTEN